MEILNNIWTAISTPNEELINILVIPLIFIENILITYLFINFLNIKATRNQKLLTIILYSIEGLLTLFFIPAPYNAFINYIITFIIVKLIYKISILKSLLAVIFPTIVFVLIRFTYFKSIC